MDKGQQPKRSIERVADQAPILRDELVDQLSTLIPQAFTEHRFDLEKPIELAIYAVKDMTDRFFAPSHNKGAQYDRVESNAGLDGC